jgi:phosphoribosylformylglycinamidine synthase I
MSALTMQQNENRPKVLIITGYGLNCEAESAHAWKLAGAEPQLVHLNDLIAQPDVMREAQALMFIGGFSFGDHMGSGHAFALRVRHRLADPLREFIAAEKLILGVCNGFQIMVKLGLLPGLDGDYFQPRVALMPNDCAAFQNFWVHVRFESDSPCVFTKELGTIPLPIRHGEGKLYVHDSAVLQKIEKMGCVACRYVEPAANEPTQNYPFNPNGSINAIAGLCNPTGRIFGLMPHPEAFLYLENHPQWDFQQLNGTLPEKGLGLLVFENAVDYLREHPCR